MITIVTFRARLNVHWRGVEVSAGENLCKICTYVTCKLLSGFELAKMFVVLDFYVKSERNFENIR